MNEPTRSDDAPLDFVEAVWAGDAAEAAAELLDPSMPYMAHAHLLPPRDDFKTTYEVDEYVRVLERLGRALTAGVEFGSDPQANQRKLAEWKPRRQKAAAKVRDR